MTVALELAAVALLILLNAFFVAGEYSLVTVRRTRMQELADEGDSSASSQPASEHEQIWEHVKTLRKRVAGFN